MNIFELFGMIAVNNKDANKAISETGKKGENLAATMGKAFDKVGKFAVNCGKVMAKGLAKGLAVGATAMTGLVVKGMNLAGELEQNMGGAEAVFEEFANTMKATAKDAYKTMGLSQSEYLATANKMGSLFKGVGYETGEAAALTIDAMQRASDVASVMGIDVSTAMESIAGAAKGNFTMMDNLGVAVNDTAIANYALEKGITKSTQKMTTQEKVALAMELFLKKTEYATGRYAEENETLAGSLTTAKAAFQNFLSGAGDADALTDALVNASDVISKNLNKLLPNLVKGLNKLMKNLTPKLPELIRTTLPGIIEGAGELLTGLALAIPDMIDVVIDVLPEIMQKLCYNLERAWNLGVWPLIQKLFKNVFGIELPKWHLFKMDLRVWWDQNIAPVLNNIKSFCSDVFGWIMDNKEAVTDALLAIGIAFIAIKAATSPASLAIGALITVLGLIIANWDDVKLAVSNAIDAIGDFFSVTIPDAWNSMIESIGSWISTNITGPIQNAIDKMKEFLGLQSGNTKPTTVKEAMQSGMSSEQIMMGLTSGDIVPYAQPHGGGKVGSFATGLDFVPRDDFPAYLHYGEAVLTRKEADVWRKGGGNTLLAAKLDQLQDALVQTVEAVRNQPMAIQVDSHAVAVLMAKEMTRSIGNRNIKTLMGMGG